LPQLVEGVRLYGTSWTRIKSAFPTQLARRTQLNLKDKWRCACFLPCVLPSLCLAPRVLVLLGRGQAKPAGWLAGWLPLCRGSVLASGKVLVHG
jgi:hypothetical protein